MPARRVAIVSGGTYGIGRGITLKLASQGWRVVAFGLDAPQMGSKAQNGTDGTRAELDARGLSAELLQADVSKSDDVLAVVDHALDCFGRVDGLVNNAGIHPTGTVLETTEEAWSKSLAVNLTGVFLLTKAAMPHLIAGGGGAIVNVASKASFGQPNRVAYSAAKGGVLAMTYALAHDHLKDHVRVNAVVPSGVLTGFTEGKPHLEAIAQRSVGGRVAMPEDVANAVAYLLSDEAALVSGAVLNVNCFAGQGGLGGS